MIQEKIKNLQNIIISKNEIIEQCQKEKENAESYLYLFVGYRKRFNIHQRINIKSYMLEAKNNTSFYGYYKKQYYEYAEKRNLDFERFAYCMEREAKRPYFQNKALTKFENCFMYSCENKADKNYLRIKAKFEKFGDVNACINGKCKGNKALKRCKKFW